MTELDCRLVIRKEEEEKREKKWVELCNFVIRLGTFGVSDQKLSARCCIAVTRPQRISLLALYLLALAVYNPAAAFPLLFSLSLLQTLYYFKEEKPSCRVGFENPIHRKENNTKKNSQFNRIFMTFFSFIPTLSGFSPSSLLRYSQTRPGIFGMNRKHFAGLLYIN